MSKDSRKEEINILDALVVLAKEKTLVLKIVILATLIALVISFMWPKSYDSSALILPPDQQQTFSGIAGMLGGMMPLNLGSEPQVNSETILSILNSRSLRVALIEEFDLYEVYSSNIIEELLLKLEQNISIVDTREGGFGFNPIISVRITVTDREPERAQKMTRFILDRLDETVRDINRRNAVEQLEIITRRYQRNLMEMEEAELAFKEYQEKHGLIEVEQQANAIINNLAEVKANMIETEIAINVMQASVSENNPELRNLRRTHAELERTFNQLVQRSDSEARAANIIPPMLDVPELALNYYRLYREVTIQNKIYETIYPQYDFSQTIAETEKRGIQILDDAHLPTYKSSPKRAFIVLGGFVFSIFFSLLIVYYRHTMNVGRETDSRQYNQIRELQEQLRFRSRKEKNES